jgi:hypothetical protein
MAEDTDTYKLLLEFKSALESLEAKTAIILNTLPPSMEQISENHPTKEGLTYDQVYQN